MSSPLQSFPHSQVITSSRLRSGPRIYHVYTIIAQPHGNDVYFLLDLELREDLILCNASPHRGAKLMGTQEFFSEAVS